MLNNIFNFQNPNNKLEVEGIRIPSTLERDTAEFQTIQGKQQVVQAANTQVAIVKTANTLVQIDDYISLPANANPDNFFEYTKRIDSNIICNRATFLFNPFDVPDEQYAIFSLNSNSAIKDTVRNIWRYRGIILGGNEGIFEIDFMPQKVSVWVTPYSPNTFTTQSILPFSIIFSNIPK